MATIYSIGGDAEEKFCRDRMAAELRLGHHSGYAWHRHIYVVVRLYALPSAYEPLVPPLTKRNQPPMEMAAGYAVCILTTGFGLSGSWSHFPFGAVLSNNSSQVTGIKYVMEKPGQRHTFIVSIKGHGD